MVADYDTAWLRQTQQARSHEPDSSYADSMSKKPKKPKEPLAIAVGQRIRQGREAKDWTQPELGVKVGASKSNLSQWENGSHMPDLKSLLALCGALGVSPNDLLGVTASPVSAAALEEAKAYDSLPPEQQTKWRKMRLTLFAPA